ncbi:unnamed protein product [Symbiodinium sp. KB8]|nr:unnamed protein product [Symbiodinium sp. KB8]
MDLPRQWRRVLRRARPTLGVLTLLLCAVAVGTAFSSGFRSSSLGARGPAAMRAFPWDQEGNARADKAYASLAEKYPEVAESGTFMDEAAGKDVIVGRYEKLGQFLGSDVALTMVEKDPILLLGDTDMQQRSFQYLTSLEDDSKKGLALEAVQKNPRLLTVPIYEYERTKPSLDGLNTAASAIDFLRPLGEVGLAVAIFSSFVVLILVLRPVFYGVGGGPSLIGMLTSGLPQIPRPWEIAQSYGINLASIVALIPIYQVISDRCFGSMGSFSSFNPRRGCFEANPPFAPAVIAGMKKHMHSLLAATEEPLSFVIAIASWENPEVAALRKSPFARGHILVPRDEQVWLDGLQSRRAPVELLIVVLQNDAAASDEKMMISREKLERLRQSCTGEAKPLGPRKRPRLDTSVETAQAAADGQGETLDAEASADRARAISIRPGGVLWRVPHWQLVKLKRFCSWFRLKAAAKSFGWTSSVTDGWHARNMRFWLKEAATVDGMTGGGVSDKDLVFNQQFMRKLARLRGNSKGRFQRALDVGAGIGRLAKGVFRTHCDHVDLLEPIEKHLQVARKDLDDTTWPGHFICGTLQDFQQPQQSLYDLVWCQWIFMYITDADVVKFLRRVSVELLAPAGTVVVKENVAQTRVGSYFDDETGELWRGANGGSRHSGPMSVLRTPQHYLKLFRESGLEVLLRRRQLFSQDEMPMTLFVLAAPSRSETVRRAAAAARAMREARHGTSDRALDGKTTREVQTRGCLPNLLRAPASRAKDVSQWGVRYPDASQRVHSPACPAMHDGMS